jgi:hypothetical protein
MIINRFGAVAVMIFMLGVIRVIVMISMVMRGTVPKGLPMRALYRQQAQLCPAVEAIK